MKNQQIKLRKGVGGISDLGGLAALFETSVMILLLVFFKVPKVSAALSDWQFHIQPNY